MTSINGNEPLTQSGEGQFSQERLTIFRNAYTIKQLRAWLLHVCRTNPPSGFRLNIVRDIIYVIAEKRERRGEIDTPERRWLLEHSFNQP